MDLNKAKEFSSFLGYKKQHLNSQFQVTVEIHQVANMWLPFDSDIIIENAIRYDDFIIIFMNELLGAKPYLGHIQMNMNYLQNVDFNGSYLFFTTEEGKRVRLS